MKKYWFQILLLLIAVIISWHVSIEFLNMHNPEKLYPSPALMEVKKLSNYFSKIEGTKADTDIYVYKGEKEGAKVLVLGGTHPDEPAGYVAAYLILENVNINKGILYVIPRANNSAFTHNLPQEGLPQSFILNGKKGKRKFRYGARITNSTDQWPDPEIYFHYPSGQKLAGNETRNLNRAYPGRPDGTLTEQIAYAIINLINTEKIDIAIDLHEASPEYPVVNAIVSPEISQDIATEATIELEFENLRYSLESSPYNFHGLSHREWADFTESLPFLFESANPIQGRLRGKTDADLLITGKDKMYLHAAGLNALTVPYKEDGIHLNERVGRHLSAFLKILEVYSRYHPDNVIEIYGLPNYDEIITNGIENYF
jgi:hypothetical protein